jgi:MraZ protein
MDPDGGSADRVILTQTFEDCLKLYPIEKWREFEQKVLDLSSFDKNVQRLKRVYVAGAVECDLDDHGRILVPKQLRTFADLDREVVWVGQLDTVELWAETNWEEAKEEAFDDPESIQQKVAEFGL